MRRFLSLHFCVMEYSFFAASLWGSISRFVFFALCALAGFPVRLLVVHGSRLLPCFFDCSNGTFLSIHFTFRCRGFNFLAGLSFSIRGPVLCFSAVFLHQSCSVRSHVLYDLTLLVRNEMFRINSPANVENSV
jgi:hypothetical protein